MKILINSFNNEHLKTISFENLDNIHEILKNFSSIKGPLEATIFAINESINSSQLTKLKNNFKKMNIFSFCIYSNNRDTVLTGKSLKISSKKVTSKQFKKEGRYSL